MANNTERIILETFEEMLEEMPFYKITVSSLVKRCRISPNTFYYHYEDIFDLLENWIGNWLSQLPSSDDWLINAKALLRKCQEKEKIVGNVLNYLSKEQIEQTIFSTDDDDIFLSFVDNTPGSNVLSELKRRNIADFCRYAVIGFFLRFVWNHSDSDIDTVVDDLNRYIQCFIRAAIEQESNSCRPPSAAAAIPE